jgi:hypothetical protein|tara:strand:+ start:122 stop:487 length:366 start_codon:yes stop_codon:yes gene_type:complete
MTVDFELDLYAGALVDGTDWLKGAAGGTYPGTLTGFQATNDDTTNTAGRGLKMVVGTCTLVQNNNEFTVGGDADTVHAIVIGGSGVAATSCSVDAGLGTGVITFACEGNLTGSTGFMAIVS